MSFPLPVVVAVREQSPDIALGVDKGGAGDQGIMFGHAANETPELLPVPFAVATKFQQLLKNHPSKMFRADAKAQVSFDYSSGRITLFSVPCSTDRLTEFPADLWREEARQTIALVEHLNCKKVSLVGSSGGAWAAVNAGLLSPDLVEKVVADSFDGRTLGEDFARKLINERAGAKQDEQAAEEIRNFLSRTDAKND